MSRERLHLVFGYPGALALALLLYSFGPTNVLGWVIVAFLHEMGHSLFHILGSKPCLPSFLFVTVCHRDTFSLTTFLIVFAILIGVFAFSRRHNNPKLAKIATCLLLILFVFSFALTNEMATSLGIFGGLAGELLFGSILVLLFFANMPLRYNWKTNRYLFLIIGMYSLVNSLILWIGVGLGNTKLPYGSAWGGKDAKCGDLNRLVNELGWSETQVTWTYLSLAIACMSAIVYAYCNALLREALNERIEEHAL